MNYMQLEDNYLNYETKSIKPVSMEMLTGWTIPSANKQNVDMTYKIEYQVGDLKAISSMIVFIALDDILKSQLN